VRSKGMEDEPFGLYFYKEEGWLPSKLKSSSLTISRSGSLCTSFGGLATIILIYGTDKSIDNYHAIHKFLNKKR